MADQNLEILIKTLADTGGLDQVKAKVQELKAQSEATSEAWKKVSAATGQSVSDLKAAAGALKSETDDAGRGFNKLGSIIGTSIGGAAVAAFAAVIAAAKAFEAEEQRVFDEMERGREVVLGLQQALLGAADAMREMALIKALPLDQGIQAATQEIIKLKTEQSLLNLSTKEGIDAYKEYTSRIQATTSLRDQLVKGQERERDVLKQTEDQIFLNNAAGNEELQIQQRVTQAYDQKLKSLLAARVPEEQAKQAAQVYAESVRYAAEVRAGAGAEVSTQDRLTALMRQQATILQNIRQQQTLINANPFMGVDAKDTALLQTYTQEMQTLQGVMAALQAQKASGLLDPAQLAQVNKELQETDFNIKLINVKLVGLNRPFTTELVQWANQFSSASRQAATALTNTLGTAINTTSQALTGLIFQTGNWRQSISQAAQSIVADLIRIALQFIISRTIMAVVNKTLGQTESGTATAQANTAFAAWNPAAVAASIASYGTAAGVGLAAYLAAIAAGAAGGIAAGALGGAGGAVTGHTGGQIGRGRLRRMHSGGLADDEIPIIAQEGEIMIQRSIAQQPGMAEFLLALNAGRMHQGGNIPAEWGDAPGWLINAWMNQPGGSLPPSADLDDPFGGYNPRFEGPQGPRVITPTDRSGRSGGWARNERGIESAFAASMFGLSQGFGFGAFGPTLLPTFWNFHPGIGFVPMAVPVGGWQPEGGLNISTSRHSIVPKPEHTGGLIRRLHSGGVITSRFPRFHSGGSMPSGGGAMRGGGAGGAVNIYAFTDLKQLTRHMASRQGRNIIFDTIKGRRIDLGFPG